MKRYKVVGVLAIIIAVFVLCGFAGFGLYVNPPTAPDEYGEWVQEFDKYMTDLGYERMQSCYEYMSDDAHALYWGYAYQVGDKFAYCRECGGRTVMYLPPELEPAAYYYSLFPELDFMINRGGTVGDFNIYWSEEADMALTISKQDVENFPAPTGRPDTLRFAIYHYKSYAAAIEDVWSHRDDGEFRYFFTWNGPMSAIGDLDRHGDLWISVSDTEAHTSIYSVTTQQ